MRTKSLSSFIQLASQKCIVPVGRAHESSKDEIMQVQLLNQSCHFIFDDKQTKRDTYRALQSEGTVYILDCGGEGFGYMGDECIVDVVGSMDGMLEKLQQILKIGTETKATHPLHSRTINTLIVDNISMYFWDLKLLNHDPKNSSMLGYTCEITGIEYYNRLVAQLQEIQTRYKCNIITSSWNNTFEKGYNYNGPTSVKPSGLDSVTYLPPKYLMGFDYLIYKSKSDDTGNSIYNKLTGQWTRVA